MILGKKKVAIFIGILILLAVGSFIGYKIYKKRISADANKSYRDISNLEKYYNSQYSFAPGELIVKFDESKIVGTQSVKDQKYLNNTVKVKNMTSLSSVSPGTYRIDFTMPKDNSAKNVVPQSVNINQTKSPSDQKQIDKNLYKIKENKKKFSIVDQIKIKWTLELKKELEKDSRVKKVYFNYIYKASGLPNDTYINPSGDGKTWSKGAFGQSYEDLWGLKQTNTDKAWDKSTGKDVVVAVIDTGVDINHEDIKNNIYWEKEGSKKFTGKSFVDKESDVMDYCFHGTHVAGTIAAIKNNKKGIVGVAPDAKIMPVKVLDKTGWGTTDNIA